MAQDEKRVPKKLGSLAKGLARLIEEMDAKKAENGEKTREKKEKY